MAEHGHLDPAALSKSARRSSGPFQPDHVAAVLGANAVGAALMFVGWWQASGLGDAESQLAWMNLSLVGVLVAGTANGWWLARGRRTVSLARATILPSPGSARYRSNGSSPVPTSTANGAGPSYARQLVAVPNTSRYHRSGCVLVTGKQVQEAGRVAHESSGRVPCEVCNP